MIRRTLASVALVAIASSAAAQGQPAPAPPAADSAGRAAAVPSADSATRHAIEHLLVTMGARRNMEATMNTMLDTYRRLMPSVPKEFWEQMVTSQSMDELVAMVVPIYARNLSLDDIRALDVFYASAAGQRFVAAQPEIVKESAAAGLVWGQAIGRRIMEQLKAKGYTKSS